MGNSGNRENLPHRRWNPLAGEWVLVSPHRTQRPWNGAEEEPGIERDVEWDPGCYLCPGNGRANGATNPEFRGPFGFPNDFPALLDESVDSHCDETGLYRIESVRGTCEVLTYSPHHSRTLGNMSLGEIQGIVELWSETGKRLSDQFESVIQFENRGEMMGCSNPHPHGQVWASDAVPTLLHKECVEQKAFFEARGQAMLPTVMEKEIESGVRLVHMNPEWVAWVPFWATWPYELVLVPRRNISRLWEADGAQKEGLAIALKDILTRYDQLFQCPFPFSFGWHHAPGRGASPWWTCHAHFFPPLLRSATVRKFMVGFELLGEAQRDLTPEYAAERLRALKGAV